jgi:hypothetical protein
MFGDLKLKIAFPVDKANKTGKVGPKNLDRVVLVAVSTNHQAFQ